MSGARPIISKPADIGAVADNDSRLTDARTPTAHAASHESGGSDPITVTDVRDHLFGPGNTTPNDLSISSGEVTADVTTHGHSQNLTFDATISSFNVPTGLADGKTLFVQLYKPVGGAAAIFSFAAGIKLMGSVTALDLSNADTLKFAWVSITRAGSTYLATITLEQ